MITSKGKIQDKRKSIFASFVERNSKVVGNWEDTCRENTLVRQSSTGSRRNYTKLSKLRETEENISKSLRKELSMNNEKLIGKMENRK